MAKKERADQLVFEQGLAESREQAARLIMAGEVFVNPESPSPLRVGKAGDMLPKESRLFTRNRAPYVSRGAYKLLTALEHFKIDVAGLTALDAGASTGGFTDLLLQRGAKKVYAVDVGKAQLHEKLRSDARVVSMEGVNLRLAGPDLLPEAVDLGVADLSFISLKSVLPSVLQYLKPGGGLVALIKPQFELGGDRTVKGVVRADKDRQEAVDGVLAFASGLGLEGRGVIPAAIRGPKGNQEYLAYWRVPDQSRKGEIISPAI